jgi:hypothetical protein
MCSKPYFCERFIDVAAHDPVESSRRSTDWFRRSAVLVGDVTHQDRCFAGLAHCGVLKRLRWRPQLA